MFPFDPKTVDRRPKLGVRRPKVSHASLAALGLLRDAALGKIMNAAPLAQVPPENRRLVHEAAVYITEAKLHRRGLAPKRPALTERVVQGLSLMVDLTSHLDSPASRMAVRWVWQAKAWRNAYDNSRKAVVQ